jgi:SAM-dependent methyltransferase
VKDLGAEWQTGLGFDPFQQVDAGEQLSQYRCLDCDLRFYYPAICGDGAFYEELSSRFSWYYEKDKWEFDVAIEILADLEGVTDILEVGCGQGHFLTRIRNQFKTHGIELNPQAIADCRAKGLNVSAQNLSSVDACFDLVAAFEVLEHLPDPREFILQALRVLKSGGYLLLAVPDPDSYFSEAEKVLLDMPPHHVLSFSKKTFQNIEKLFSLDQLLVRQEPLRFAHYKSYVSNFIGRETPSTGRARRVESLFQRVFGFPIDRAERRLEERLSELLVATSYQNAKDKLLGQTHLVLYQKR